MNFQICYLIVFVFCFVWIWHPCEVTLTVQILSVFRSLMYFAIWEGEQMFVFFLKQNSISFHFLCYNSQPPKVTELCALTNQVAWWVTHFFLAGSFMRVSCPSLLHSCVYILLICYCGTQTINLKVAFPLSLSFSCPFHCPQTCQQQWQSRKTLPWCEASIQHRRWRRIWYWYSRKFFFYLD